MLSFAFPRHQLAARGGLVSPEGIRAPPSPENRVINIREFSSSLFGGKQLVNWRLTISKRYLSLLGNPDQR